MNKNNKKYKKNLIQIILKIKNVNVDQNNHTKIVVISSTKKSQQKKTIIDFDFYVLIN